MKPIIAYCRVSTERQGKSGLGLEAQRGAIARFAETNGFALLGEEVEVETGKGADALDRRPKLKRALDLAKKHKCSQMATDASVYTGVYALTKHCSYAFWSPNPSISAIRRDPPLRPLAGAIDDLAAAARSGWAKRNSRVLEGVGGPRASVEIAIRRVSKICGMSTHKHNHTDKMCKHRLGFSVLFLVDGFLTQPVQTQRRLPRPRAAG